MKVWSSENQVVAGQSRILLEIVLNDSPGSGMSADR